jgi:Rod binding domain-containing protein
MGMSSIGLGSLASQSTALDSSADRMIQGLKEPKSVTDGAKIDKGAKEFEAVLVGSWLQQAEQSFATVPGADEDSEDVGRGSMMSLGVQTLATSLASTGGIGIGTMIAKAMHAAADKVNGTPEPPPAPAQTKVTNEKRGGLD